MTAATATRFLDEAAAIERDAAMMTKLVAERRGRFDERDRLVFTCALCQSGEAIYEPRRRRWWCLSGGGHSGDVADLANIIGVSDGVGPSDPEPTNVHEPVPSSSRAPATANGRPALDDAALHGLAGDVVRAVDPHSEADPVATLVNFLVMFGCAVGPGPHALVGDRAHHANEFAVLVGATSKARKGTSHDTPQRIIADADLGWLARVQGGLSSGEGVIWAVRDAIQELRKGDLVTVDSGVVDKRLLLVEEEYAAVLKVAGREGNTLSEVIRRAWDGRPLQILTKNRGATCDEPHISVLAHVTEAELRRALTDVSAANGFANRFLWLAVKRSKVLPEGGRVPEAERTRLIARTREAIAAARTIDVVKRDDAAREVWSGIYPELSEPAPGLWGAVTDRAEAHVLRLSLIYALLDGSPVITVDHLLAALGLWDYAAASARLIFGDATGDPIADRILTALRANGPMTQSELTELLGRNVNAGRMGKAFETLLAAELVYSVREDTGGRPRTVWVAR
jgi:hypothetical protein